MVPARPPLKFFKALAAGAPAPFIEKPVRLERMIHFVAPQVEKIRAKVPELIKQVDVVLGNLEDAIPASDKEAARKGFIELARANDFGRTGLWTRINALNSPWVLDDIVEIMGAVGNKLDVIMLPKVEGPWDIYYLDQLLAQLEAKHGIKKPVMIHALLETAEGVNNVEAIAAASPRMHGMSLGPADLAASRAMKTTRVGGGHPSYGVLADAGADAAAPRAFYQQDLWHYTVGRMVDACATHGIKPFYGPFGDFSDTAACEAQFRNAFLAGMRRGMDVASLADRNRPARLHARSGRGCVRKAHPGGHARWHGSRHGGRKNARRRDLEASEGDGRPERFGRGEGWAFVLTYT